MKDVNEKFSSVISFRLKEDDVNLFRRVCRSNMISRSEMLRKITTEMLQKEANN